jgi:hypothetical protein
MLNCKPHELASLCCIWSQTKLNRWLKDDKFPTHVSLHFAIIESFWLKLSSGHEQKPIVPMDLLKP